MKKGISDLKDLKNIQAGPRFPLVFKQSLHVLFTNFKSRTQTLKVYYNLTTKAYHGYLKETYSNEDLTVDIRRLKKEEKIELLKSVSNNTDWSKAQKRYYETNKLPKYVYYSSLTLLYSETEKFLKELVIVMEEAEGRKILFKKQRSESQYDYLLRCLKNLGVDIVLDRKMDSHIKTLCELRNQFIHEVDEKHPKEMFADFLNETIKAEIENAVSFADYSKEYEYWIKSVNEFANDVKKVFDKTFEGKYRYPHKK